MARLGDKYQVDELAAKYTFTGRTPLTVTAALAIKEELEAIDRLLEQLKEAAETAQVGIIDLDELSQFIEAADVDQLRELRAAGGGVHPPDGRTARSGADGRRLPADPARDAAVPGAAAGTDLQRPGGGAQRAARAGGLGRGRGRTAANADRTSSATRWPTWMSSGRSSMP